MSARVAIVDYGVGNLFNIERALDAVGVQSTITSSANQISESSHLLLPGVGAFQPGMEHLKERGLDQTIHDFVKSGKPVMGVCLGMQLLLTKSYENGETDGLNIIPGEVVPLMATSVEKVPQIGWNKLEKNEHTQVSPILNNLSDHPHFYFLHSYQVQVANEQHCVAKTIYGPNIFSSVIAKDNVSGCQFHPELSAANGLAILKNFTKQ